MSLPRAIADDPRALVVVDWSGWIHRAWHARGLDGFASRVVGWLAQLLSDPMPPSLVMAVDPPTRSTFRDKATRDRPEEKRYKAGRIPKPKEFYEVNERLMGLLYAHRIPILWPDDGAEQSYEADDAAAAAVRLARTEGRSVALITADKDWCQLLTDDPTRPRVVRWDGKERVEGEEEVRAKWGVGVEQLTDFFALKGDKGDNVPGVRGIGDVGAATLLTEYGSLDAALAVTPTTKILEKLHQQRDEALFSRSLIRLWDEAPIAWEPEQQPVGGFDARAAARIYRSFGFTRLEQEIPTFPKAVW